MNTRLTIVAHRRPAPLTVDELHALTAPRVEAYKARRAALREVPRPLARTERGRRVGLALVGLAFVVLILQAHSDYGIRGLAALTASVGLALLFQWLFLRAVSLGEERGGHRRGLSKTSEQGHAGCVRGETGAPGDRRRDG